MRRILPIILLLVLLTSCAGGLTRIAPGQVRGWSTDRITLTRVDGILQMEIYNGNKKSITFESGRITLSEKGRQLLVSDLTAPVTLAGSEHTLAYIPLRVRFSRQLLTAALAARFTDAKPTGHVDIAGTVEFRQEGNSRSRTVRFRRRIKTEELVSLAGGVTDPKEAPLPLY